jgi:hypothetical protein
MNEFQNSTEKAANASFKQTPKLGLKLSEIRVKENR